jgi:two-component system alkaline phosphatase synthesis response regulator PhoP
LPKILVVDDDPSLRHLLRATLGAGHRILEADEGLEALKVARRERPDLVLLDVRLPGLSGLDVCREIKSDPALSRTKVVIISVQAAGTDRVAGLDAGADEYVVKPFSPRALLATLDEVLSAEC